MNDLEVTITIPDVKVAQAIAALFVFHPKPILPKDEEGNDIGEEVTDKVHFQSIMAMLLNREIRRGKCKLDTPTPDKTDYCA